VEEARSATAAAPEVGTAQFSVAMAEPVVAVSAPIAEAAVEPVVAEREPAPTAAPPPNASASLLARAAASPVEVVPRVHSPRPAPAPQPWPPDDGTYLHAIGWVDYYKCSYLLLDLLEGRDHLARFMTRDILELARRIPTGPTATRDRLWSAR
jgi:hypothetical protein